MEQYDSKMEEYNKELEQWEEENGIDADDIV
jgi:hypothetical protein